MSSQEMRAATPRVAAPTLSLAETLTAAGEKVLDDDAVATMMKAATYEIHPATPAEELEERISNGATLYHDEWAQVDYDFFCSNPLMMRDCGGAPPTAVKEKVERIRRLLPDARVVLHVVPEDPYVQIVRGDEKCWVAGWAPHGHFFIC